MSLSPCSTVAHAEGARLWLWFPSNVPWTVSLLHDCNLNSVLSAVYKKSLTVKEKTNGLKTLKCSVLVSYGSA